MVRHALKQAAGPALHVLIGFWWVIPVLGVLIYIDASSPATANLTVACQPASTRVPGGNMGVRSAARS
jgi:hypothetical protein